MKPLLSAALALSIGMSSVAMAQPMQGGPGGPPPPPPPGYHHGPGGPGGAYQRPPGPGPYQHPPRPWRTGQRFDVPRHDWRPVRDWHHHHGLYPPPPGQEWVEYNNQYVLVAVASGLIGAVLGATMAAQP